MLNEEVQTDSQTVKKLFGECYELIVPAGSLTHEKFTEQKTELRKLMRQLRNIHEKEVKIVLNTHGTPGRHDIDVSLITELVRQLSAEDIKINTIYALMCDGFTQRKGTDGPFYKTSLLSLETRPKPSSMANLRLKLNNLETKIEQSFAIKGFAYPYTPSQAQKLIMSFLLDEGGGETIYVHTQEQKEDDFNYLLGCIELCRSGISAQDPAYIKASNALGALLHEMKTHIDAYLNGFDEKLYEGSIPLFTGVRCLANCRSDNPTTTQFEHQYKRWIKECKLTSATRLAILEGYCHYQKQCQKEHLLFSAENTRMTFFSGKIDLSDEPLAGKEIEYNQKM